MEGQPTKYAKGVVSYALPGARSVTNRLAKSVLGGWTLRSIIGWRSGIPFNVTSGSDFAANGRSAGQRPDVVFGVDPYVEDLSTQTWLTSAAFSTAALRSEKRFGNLGFDALVGPRAFTMDSGLHKNFQITDRQKVTFRLETFNTLNHTVFSNPNGTLNNPNFGRILSARSPRAYQIALKYVF
jgi:hypothetical protein